MFSRLYKLASKPLLSDTHRFIAAAGITALLTFTATLPSFLLTFGTISAAAISFISLLTFLEISKRTPLRLYALSLLIAAATPLSLIYFTNLTVTPLHLLVMSGSYLAAMLSAYQLMQFLSTKKRGFFFAFTAATVLAFAVDFASYPLLAPLFTYGVLSAIPAFAISLYLLYGASKCAADIACHILPTATKGTFTVLEAVANYAFDAICFVVKLPSNLYQRYQGRTDTDSSPLPPMNTTEIKRTLSDNEDDPDANLIDTLVDNPETLSKEEKKEATKKLGDRYYRLSNPPTNTKASKSPPHP